MIDRRQVKSIISQFTGHQNLIGIPRVFVKLMDGDWNAAAILYLLLEYSRLTEDGWINLSMFVSYAYEMAGGEMPHIRRAIDKLHRFGFIEVRGMHHEQRRVNLEHLLVELRKIEVTK